MRVLTFLLCVLTLHINGAAQIKMTLRHFMQSTPPAPDAIPYGNNPEAGHYVLAGDAKIYYEVYGIGPTMRGVPVSGAVDRPVGLDADRAIGLLGGQAAALCVLLARNVSPSSSVCW